MRIGDDAERDSGRKTMLAIGCLSIPAAIAVSTLLNGWALVTLWRWFIVPGFGAEPISFVAAIGASLIVGYMTDHSSADPARGADESAGEIFLRMWIDVITRPLVAVGFGWFVLWVSGKGGA